MAASACYFGSGMTGMDDEAWGEGGQESTRGERRDEGQERYRSQEGRRRRRRKCLLFFGLLGLQLLQVSNYELARGGF